MKVRKLRKLQKWILAEPLRFDMQWWSARPEIIAEKNPPCGTVGCLAAMVCHMEGHRLRPGTGILPGSACMFVPDLAKSILGIDEKQSSRLFFIRGMHGIKTLESAWPRKFAAAYKKAKTPAAKVKVAVARIEHFIKTKGAE